MAAIFVAPPTCPMMVTSQSPNSGTVMFDTMLGRARRSISRSILFIGKGLLIYTEKFAAKLRIPDDIDKLSPSFLSTAQLYSCNEAVKLCCKMTLL